MTGRNINIYFQEETYNKIKDLITQRKISRFINEATEEKLAKKQNTEEFQKKLIAGYKSIAKNKKIQAELALWDETINDQLKK
jgi:hypothetical protein